MTIRQTTPSECWTIGSENKANHHQPLQTTISIWDGGYSRAGKKQAVCLKVSLLQSSHAMSVERDAFANTHRSKSCIFTTYRWWFAAASLVGKPPPKRRNYAEFGTLCISVPVKSMPSVFCVMYKVSGRYIYTPVYQTWGDSESGVGIKGRI